VKKQGQIFQLNASKQHTKKLMSRDREERQKAREATQRATQEELKIKIQVKQEESANRREENMEQIKQRALECCFFRTDVAPRLAPYETHKLCTLCNVWVKQI
jgi:hypothetical protein